MSAPPVRNNFPRNISYEAVQLAIKTVENVLPHIIVGPPIIRSGPAGEVHVDVPLMYQNFALDRVHYDPYLKAPSPKGRPVRAWGVSVNADEVRNVMEQILKELRVIDAAEYREPESAWAIPIAWKLIIVAHIKVSSDGKEIVPDYGLTEEVRRYVL